MLRCPMSGTEPVDALADLVPVPRPGGHVLLSAMSPLGAMRAFGTHQPATRRHPPDPPQPLRQQPTATAQDPKP
jgi:hypothetical protein